MDFIKEYLPILLVAIGGISAWFGMRSRVERLEQHRDADSKLLSSINQSVDQLEKNEAANNATRDQMLAMLQENRLDVKQILQQIATIAANQNQSNESN